MMQGSNPPVGVVCEHSSALPSPMQDPRFRKDDGDKWIYFHAYYFEGSGVNVKLRVCGKPERWRWKHYLRECGGCGIKFSNPWIPVCEECYVRDGGKIERYPGWDRIIRHDMRLERYDGV